MTVVVVVSIPLIFAFKQLNSSRNNATAHTSAKKIRSSHTHKMIPWNMHLCKKDGKLIYSSMEKVNQCLVRWEWDINHVVTRVLRFCHKERIHSNTKTNHISNDTTNQLTKKCMAKRDGGRERRGMQTSKVEYRPQHQNTIIFFSSVKIIFFVSIFSNGIMCYQYPVNINASIQYNVSCWCR